MLAESVISAVLHLYPADKAGMVLKIKTYQYVLSLYTKIMPNFVLAIRFQVSDPGSFEKCELVLSKYVAMVP